MEVQNHPNIELLTYSEVESVEGSIGNFSVKIKKKARYVDLDKCTGCGDCIAVCRLKDRIDNEFDFGLGKRGAIYMPFPQAIPLKCTIDDSSCLFLTRGKCGESPPCRDACGQKAIDFDQKDEVIEKKVGAIVVATGYDLLDVSTLGEYSYNHSADVLSSLEMERLICSSGPTKGEIIRPSDGKKPKSVTYILCVGSRDVSQCSWCCRIGCMSALKQAFLLDEKFDDLEINICYNDIRAFGKGYEEFYGKIRGIGANMFRGRPSEVRVQTDGSLKMDVFDTTTSKLFEVSSDMVVLVPALVPRSGANELARLLHLTQSADGFLLEAHPKLRPMDTFVGGVFVGGCCQAPKDICDSVAQASGAASRAATLLSQKELEIDPLIAAVDPDACTGCGVCIDVCPYNARSLDEIKRIAVVEGALCAGCGACIVACPSNASIHKNFTRKQLMDMVDDIV